jgi:hypothetical protein
MPTVTSENKAEFDANKMAKDIPASSTPEPSNLEYMKYSKLASEASEKANDSISHAEASKHHGLAFGLAGLPENKTYHRHHKLSHSEQEDKMYRGEQRKMRHETKKEKMARALKR